MSPELAQSPDTPLAALLDSVVLTVEDAGHRYTADGGITLAGALGAAVALLTAVGVLVGRAGTRRPAPPTRLLRPALALASFLPLGLLLLVANRGSDAGSWVSAFPELWLVDVTAAGLGAAAFALVAWRARSVGRLAFALLPWGVSQVGVAHGHWLLELGALPHVVLGGASDLHVGRGLDLTLRMEGPDAHLWQIEAAHRRVEGEVVGLLPVPARATRGPLAVETTLFVVVGEAKADPLLPLIPGATWELASADGLTTVSIEVGLPSAEGALETYPLRATLRREKALHTAVTSLAYGFNGATRGEEGRPLLVREGAPSGVAGEERVACRLALLSMECECALSAGPEPVALPGPVRCEGVDRSLGEVGLAALAEALTLGAADTSGVGEPYTVLLERARVVPPLRAPEGAAPAP